MKQIAQGKSKAFRELFTRHGSLVMGYSRRLVKEKALAEDVSQEVWIKVVRAAPEYRDQGTFKSWLLKIVRNTSLTLMRSRNLLTVSDESIENTQVNLHDFETLLNHQNDLQLVKALIDELPDNQRTALVLWLTEELSYEDLATELDTSVQSVKSLLFRARQHLQARMKGAS